MSAKLQIHVHVFEMAPIQQMSIVGKVTPYIFNATSKWRADYTPERYAEVKQATATLQAHGYIAVIEIK